GPTLWTRVYPLPWLRKVCRHSPIQSMKVIGCVAFQTISVVGKAQALNQDLSLIIGCPLSRSGNMDWIASRNGIFGTGKKLEFCTGDSFIRCVFFVDEDGYRPPSGFRAIFDALAEINRALVWV